MKTSLKNLFLEELAEMYDAEQRIVKALPKLIEAATCSQLQSALQSHLQETEGHADKVERVFAAFDEEPKTQKSAAMVGLLNEGSELVSDHKKTPAVNAAIICAAQKVEHYEIASYGCLREWARLLDNEDAAQILDEILDEEKAADSKLNEQSSAKNEEALAEVS